MEWHRMDSYILSFYEFMEGEEERKLREPLSVLFETKFIDRSCCFVATTVLNKYHLLCDHTFSH